MLLRGPGGAQGGAAQGWGLQWRSPRLPPPHSPRRPRSLGLIETQKPLANPPQPHRCFANTSEAEGLSSRVRLLTKQRKDTGPREAKVKIRATKSPAKKTLKSPERMGRRGSVQHCLPLGTPPLHRWTGKRPPALKGGPQTLKGRRKTELELDRQWGRAAAAGAGGSDTQGLCHVTPSGYCESWRAPGGSGGTAGPGPDSREHRRARAMVRARGAQAPSAAGVAAMLGPGRIQSCPPEVLSISPRPLSSRLTSLPPSQHPLLQPSARQAEPMGARPRCGKGPRPGPPDRKGVPRFRAGATPHTRSCAMAVGGPNGECPRRGRKAEGRKPRPQT